MIPEVIICLLHYTQKVEQRRGFILTLLAMDKLGPRHKEHIHGFQKKHYKNLMKIIDFTLILFA